jgi:hypothetical protein
MHPGSGVARSHGGAVAQLGERLHGMQEVRGSIPLGSTNPVLPQFYLPNSMNGMGILAVL